MKHICRKKARKERKRREKGEKKLTTSEKLLSEFREPSHIPVCFLPSNSRNVGGFEV